MKKIITISIALVLISVTVLGFSACANRKAPNVEDIYDRVVELVEASHELNTVFYGVGLPTHPANSVYAEMNHIYHNFYNVDTYEMVSASAKFLTSYDIKNAAEKVYSSAYLEDVVYPSIFTGHAVSDASGKPHFAHARYIEDNNWIYQVIDTDPRYQGMLVYDYSTMRVVKPSNATMCFVEIDCHEDSNPQKTYTQRLTLVLQEDGKWYLDSFTG